jgi:hypothetical protein
MKREFFSNLQKRGVGHMSHPTDDLPALIAQGRFMFLQMAQAMLSADLAAAGFGTAAQADARYLRDAGAALVLEVSAMHTGGAGVSLVALLPSGERRVLATIAEQAECAH